MTARLLLATFLALSAGGPAEWTSPSRPEMLILVPASDDPYALSESAVRAMCGHYGFVVLGPAEAKPPVPPTRPPSWVEDGRFGGND